MGNSANRLRFGNCLKVSFKISYFLSACDSLHDFIFCNNIHLILTHGMKTFIVGCQEAFLINSGKFVLPTIGAD